MRGTFHKSSLHTTRVIVNVGLVPFSETEVEQWPSMAKALDHWTHETLKQKPFLLKFASTIEKSGRLIFLKLVDNLLRYTAIVENMAEFRTQGQKKGNERYSVAEVCEAEHAERCFGVGIAFDSANFSIGGGEFGSVSAFGPRLTCFRRRSVCLRSVRLHTAPWTSPTFTSAKKLPF